MFKMGVYLKDENHKLWLNLRLHFDEGFAKFQ